MISKTKAIESKWQDISTAPKKGVYLGIIVGRTFNGKFYTGQPFLAEYDEDDGHVCVHQTELKPHRPTQWMPLPTPPLETKLGGLDG